MLAQRGARPAPRLTPPEIPSLAVAGAEQQHRWGAPVFFVVGSGEAGGLALRAGDLLVVHPQAQTGDLVVLAPARFGRPMLGRLGPRGAVAEPSGVPCSADRWRVAGRVHLHVRPVPRDMPAVLRFPEAPSALAPELQAHLLLELGGPVGAEVEALLRRRLPGVAVLGERWVRAQGGGALVQAPMALIEALAAELWQRFHLPVRAAVADDAAGAQALLRLLPRAGLGVKRGAGPVGAQARVDPPEEALRQLGFWKG